MKKINIFILMLLIHLCVFAANTAELNIKAFKTGFDYTNLDINDRTTQNDVPLNGQGEIELNPVLDRLLGSTTASDNLTSYVIFSYRLESNQVGNFTLNITLSDLERQNITAPADNDSIDVLYQIGNFNEVFETLGSDDSSPSSSVGNSEIKGPGNTEGNKPGDVSQLATDSQKASFDMTYNATSDSDSTVRTWIARGAVGMIIDNYQYNKANYGNYKAIVTVTLTSN